MMKPIGELLLNRMSVAKEQEAIQATLESALLLGDMMRAADIRRTIHELLDKHLDQTYDIQNAMRIKLKGMGL